jgi:RimJ/RimL family protein N-acetyltransferase
MGVRKAFHDSVTGSALAFSVIMALRDYHLLRGVERIEMSWVLEDNKGMRNILESAGAKPYKTYRVYEKALAV